MSSMDALSDTNFAHKWVLAAAECWSQDDNVQTPRNGQPCNVSWSNSESIRRGSGVTVEYQRKQAKELQNYFKSLKAAKTIERSK